MLYKFAHLVDRRHRGGIRAIGGIRQNNGQFSFVQINSRRFAPARPEVVNERIDEDKGILFSKGNSWSESISSVICFMR